MSTSSSPKPVVVTHTEGDREWFLNGKHHREDGPALELADGDRWWCIDGSNHREDGPAFEGRDGQWMWFVRGLLHRLDGPAVRLANGTLQWYVEGMRVSREDYDDVVKEYMQGGGSFTKPCRRSDC
jgi:hypothetical protein